MIPTQPKKPSQQFREGDSNEQQAVNSLFRTHHLEPSNDELAHRDKKRVVSGRVIATADDE